MITSSDRPHPPMVEGKSAFGVCPHCGRFLARIERAGAWPWQFWCRACARYFEREQVISWEVTWATGEVEVWEPAPGQDLVGTVEEGSVCS